MDRVHSLTALAISEIKHSGLGLGLEQQEFCRFSLMNVHRAWAASVAATASVLAIHPEFFLRKNRRHEHKGAKALLVGAWSSIASWGTGDDERTAASWACHSLGITYSTVRKHTWEARQRRPEMLSAIVTAYGRIVSRVTPAHALATIVAGWCDPSRLPGGQPRAADRLLQEAREWIQEADRG